MVGAPTAKNNGGAMIAAITAGGTQRRACSWCQSPRQLAAAPQTDAERMMLMHIGAKARTPAINSARVLGTCGMGHFCE
jgi:hypothetical protein